MTAQTAASQVVNVVGLILLGWLLTQREHGLFALTMTIAAGGSLVQQIGLRAILIRRNRAFQSWSNPAAWMMLSLGVAAALVMLVIAPYAERLYRANGLAGMIQVMAIALPFNSLAIVPLSRLQAQLRFRLLAVLQFVRLTGEMVGMVVLAAIGFGAYSFVIPRVIAAVGMTAALWFVAKPVMRWSPQLRRWRYMMRELSSLSTGNAANYLLTQSDRIVLGLMYSDAVVGVYFYAMRLAQRPVTMLTTSLGSVLFPVLSKIQDNPRRQADAFLKASRLLAILGAPFCMLMGVCADPLVHAILHPRWLPCIPVLQVLAPGIVFAVVGKPAGALLIAQGRLWTRTIMGGVLVVVLVTAVTIAAALGAEVAVGAAMAFFFAISGLGLMFIGVRIAGLNIFDVLKCFVVAYPSSAAAAGIGWAVGRTLPPTTLGHWLELVVVSAVTLGLYAGLIRWLAPRDFRELLERLQPLYARLRRQRQRSMPVARR